MRIDKSAERKAERKAQELGAKKGVCQEHSYGMRG
jgi:hypothetical protein